MKNAWWKLLVVVLLVVVVAIVISAKNKPLGTAKDSHSNSSSRIAQLDEKSGNGGMKDMPQKTSSSEETSRQNNGDETVGGTKNLENADKSSSKTKTQQVASNSGVRQSSSGKNPNRRLPKLLDLGADKCIPCKMMAPILEELANEYKGKLEVVFIDVWENPNEAEKYGIQSIPTQIFYDENGKEFYRHIGYISKEDIIAVFKEKGIKLQ